MLQAVLPTPGTRLQNNNILLNPPFAYGSVVLMVVSVILLLHHLARPFDHFLVGYRIPAILCGLAAMVALLTALPAFKTKTGLTFLAFLAWMVAVTPLSSWRGGSVFYVRDFLVFWGTLFMVLACAPTTMRHLRLLFFITALAPIANVMLTRQYQAEVGRLVIAGAYANSGDAALLTGFAIPFWLFLTRQIRNPVVSNVLALAGTLILVRTILLTATRSLIISLFCLILLWFVRASLTTRLFGGIVLMIAMVGVVLTIPSSTLIRLKTISSALSAEQAVQSEGGDELITGEAFHSAQERRSLFRDGIVATITHPIWGVGPGQFGQFRWSHMGDPNQKKKGWLKTHMTYLELSASLGIPGLLLYLLFAGTVYGVISRIRNLTRAQQTPAFKMGYQMAICLEAAFVLFIVNALFLTVEAHPYMFLLAGFAVAAERLLSLEVARMKAAKPPKEQGQGQIGVRRPIKTAATPWNSPPRPLMPTRSIY